METNCKSIRSMKLRDDSIVESLPYEKFMKYGPNALNDSELLAIIIRTGTRNKTPMDIAKEIIHFGNNQEKGLNVLNHISVKELREIEGIGEVKAVKIKCIAELSRRMSLDKGHANLDFSKPKTIADYYMQRLRHEERENVYLLSLNSKMMLLDEMILSVGTVDASLVSPREVFIHALRQKAVYVIIMHNHPAGNPAPSKADLQITKMIQKAGEVLNVELLDHIIIGDNCYTSFKEKNLL